ncbi:carbohydrate-binding module family 63 protein [Cenococcum geophilum 1.58]|uniref:carbohydrate-binding module family 63 protein n=1 Tax=Cenococcum geophilum 1.58 TaxID=794803 RepID=UPI00358FD39D|nr:carbohydrate-binding module family 63 protein [Cenococcum geophilum 1.58]
MKLLVSIPLPILALCASFSLVFAQSDFCSPNIVYVTVTPTTTITAAQQTCGLTTYTTTTRTTTTTVTVQPSQAVEISSAAGTSVAPLSSVVYTSLISNSSTQGTFSFVLPSSTSEAIAQSSSVSVAEKNAAKPSPTTLSTTVLHSATSRSTAGTVVPTSSSTALSGSNSGQATYYGGNISGGTCSFSTYSLPSGIFGTALSDSNWDNAGNCGACIQVTGPSGNSIKAMVVDECPGCGTNHLDLFPDAFSALANPTLGIINVSWDIVPCGITSPLRLRNKEGTSRYWFAMQVINANIPVAKLEVSTDGGATWQATTRQNYNFFVGASGFGTDTVNVKVTSSTGKVITVNSVGVASGTEVTASGNFA